jgi:flagellar P-ring protein precursor FlgI
VAVSADHGGNAARRNGRTRAARAAVALLAVLASIAPARDARAARVGDLTHRAGEVPRRLVGYGLVTGLDGTGDRSFGGSGVTTPTVRSVVNLLRRFGVEVPGDRLRLRNVAAVLVTAEVSPWLRSGGRFEVQVSALGDATSLRGGVLWMTPLVGDPREAPAATAQGPLLTAGDAEARRPVPGRANAGRVPGGGLLEVDPPPATLAPRLLLREPDLAAARAIAGALDRAFGPGTARVEDPGSIAVRAPADSAGGALALLAAADTVQVEVPMRARIVIDARNGSVVAGGDLRVGPAVVSHRGYTVEVGGPAGAGSDAPGIVRVEGGATVREVTLGLHAAGAAAGDVAAMLEALRAAGAIDAEVSVR